MNMWGKAAAVGAGVGAALAIMPVGSIFADLLTSGSRDITVSLYAWGAANGLIGAAAWIGLGLLPWRHTPSKVVGAVIGVLALLASSTGAHLLGLFAASAALGVMASAWMVGALPHEATVKERLPVGLGVPVGTIVVATVLGAVLQIAHPLFNLGMTMACVIGTLVVMQIALRVGLWRQGREHTNAS